MTRLRRLLRRECWWCHGTGENWHYVDHNTDWYQADCYICHGSGWQWHWSGTVARLRRWIGGER